MKKFLCVLFLISFGLVFSLFGNIGCGIKIGEKSTSIKEIAANKLTGKWKIIEINGTPVSPTPQEYYDFYPDRFIYSLFAQAGSVRSGMPLVDCTVSLVYNLNLDNQGELVLTSMSSESSESPVGCATTILGSIASLQARVPYSQDGGRFYFIVDGDTLTLSQLGVPASSFFTTKSIKQ